MNRNFLNLKHSSFAVVAITIGLFFAACVSSVSEQKSVSLSHGIDESAGGDSAYIISISNATFYLEKSGGGLSSMLDKDGIDWLGFHKKKGSAHKGEYRGFPNAIHKQDGNYFHAMNASTDPSTSIVEIETAKHVRIVFTSGNGQWKGQWDFYPDRCDFTMSKVSSGYKYWVQYEGVPGLPGPEWMAFGDEKSSRMLYLLHHQDDNHPDDYVSRPDMTVLGFGRRNKDKYLDTPQSFSLGFVESNRHPVVQKFIESIDP